MSLEIHAGHPLFAELRKKLLWHCTSAMNFRKICGDGFIRPIEGTSNRWSNRPYACQTLGAVCLFDFTTESSEKVLSAANRWQQFVGSEKPATVLLGLDERKLPGRIVRYPENRDTTPEESSGPIPWVEVCHVGPIPVSAVVSHLLVCAADYSKYSTHENLDDETLISVEREFREICALEAEQRAKQAAQFRAATESPEFKAQLERARQRAEEMKRGKP